MRNVHAPLLSRARQCNFPAVTRMNSVAHSEETVEDTMRTGRLTLLIATIIIGLICAPMSADAQLGGLKKKIKKEAEKQAEKAAEEAIEGKEETPEESADTTTEAEAAKTGAGSAAGGDAEELKPGEGAWANYDFIPGDRVLYYEDFDKSPVGDFPQRLEFEEGNMEVVEWQGSRYLRMPTHSDFNIPLPEVLPERFTIEFDLYLPGGVFKMYGPSEDRSNPAAHSLVKIAHGKAGVTGSGGGESEVDLPRGTFDNIVRCRVMGYGKYLKVYVNETRVANIPNADFIRADRIHVNLYNFSQDGVLIDNIRVAEGGKKILYDALMADGRVATRGIYFDSGSDRLRPESTPTLKQMGQMLQEHADLSLVIEGHTDDVGDDASNLDLSQRRAAAVREFLIANYQIDGARLEAKGFGESQPAAPNTTPEGRQNNRRVELVKL